MPIDHKELKRLAARAAKVLVGKGVPDERLAFGGEGPVPKRKPFVPTDARSEFLANRAMGDWAEDVVTRAINSSAPGYKAVHYGEADTIAAGEEGFGDFYRARLEQVRIYGKRPDLLVVPADTKCEDDVTAIAAPDLADLVSKAAFAIEVRSSKFAAVESMRRRQELGRNTRSSLNFTVKAEDLIIVYRWMERYGCPQIYCQVFFDSMFAINMLKIFEMIGDGNFQMEAPDKSQGKVTCMIPVTSGEQVGTMTIPDFTAEVKVTQYARYDAFVRPVGGQPTLDWAAMRRVAGI